MENFSEILNIRIMYRITLEDYLNTNGSVQSGIMAKSKLIDKLEIYGFVNACKDEDMYNVGYTGYVINGIVNKEPKLQIILSNYIYQVTSISIKLLPTIVVKILLMQVWRFQYFKL